MSIVPFRTHARTVAALGLGLALYGCSSDQTNASFSENVGLAFSPCNEAEIRFLSAKHNLMGAFEPCGSNNFAHASWSPDGTHLYFQLPMSGGHVMNAEAADKRTITVPTETPIGRAAWLSASRLAVPVGPAAGATSERISLFDKDQSTVFTHEVPGLVGVDDLFPDKLPAEAILFTAKDAAGTRGVYRMTLGDGHVSPAFPWATGKVETFTWEPAQDLAVIGADGAVRVVRGATGEEVAHFADARRGVVNPSGRWLVLESDGEAVSIFFQRSWDELSENARKREQARAERFEQRLPEAYPKEVKPPTLSIVDLTTGKRWRISSFQGQDFEWYRPTDTYGSFLLWGIEGKEMNRNVILGNLADRLRSIEKGTGMLGVAPWDAPEGGAGAATPAAVPAGSEPDSDAKP